MRQIVEGEAKVAMQQVEQSSSVLHTRDQQRYWPIGAYGVIGDCRTAALIAPDGSVDWCCMPHFDSPAIFCRLLDAEQGGYFRVSPAAAASSTTATSSTVSYLPGTNILETTFQADAGRLRLLDFMPIRERRARPHILQELSAHLSLAPHGLRAGLERELGNDVAAAHRISRIATCLAGTVPVEVVFKPTFDYARHAPHFERHMLTNDIAGVIANDGERYLVLMVRCLRTVRGDVSPLTFAGGAGELRITTTLEAGHGLVAGLNYARSAAEATELLERLVGHDAERDLDETLSYWRDWSARCQYTGTYQGPVLRSALALKLCTFEPTGAIVAAPTTSLPEEMGGVRNWDYRYTWLRDSAFTLGALGALGYTDEARDYFHFLHDLQISDGADLRIMYGIRGEHGDALTEQTLGHLAGYGGSRPVRIGNGAAMQSQLDIYGELLDAAYSYSEHAAFRGRHRHADGDRDLRHLAEVVANYVVDNWQTLDRGIWEVRGDPRAFVYSRAMCWVALDRACTMAPRHGHHAEMQRWSATRDAIQADVLAHGFSDQLNSFVQAYGSDVLDASNLRLPLTNFLPWSDPRIRGTAEATKRDLAQQHGLVYRYRPAGANDGSVHQGDGLPGSEGAFLACTFWLIENLCHLGEIEEARERFERVLAFASPLGLFAEEVDPASGALLGNYPQAFTHIGLINSAVTLQRAQDGRMDI